MNRPAELVAEDEVVVVVGTGGEVALEHLGIPMVAKCRHGGVVERHGPPPTEDFGGPNVGPPEVGRSCCSTEARAPLRSR